MNVMVNIKNHNGNEVITFAIFFAAFVIVQI